MRRSLIIVAVLALVVSACGGSAEETTTTAAETTTTAAETTTTVAATGLSRQGFPEQCPATGESFNMQNAAAYQVFGQIDYFDQSTGQAAVHHAFIGTAWAVGERLLATNAHVTEAYTSAAQQGVQFSRAIAVQSGTGEVIRLLRALTHPDYSGDPLGSPDVGLFTSQEKLPAPLTLAPADSVLDLGDEFQLTGFPGDVDEFITVVPGQTIPQATSLSGNISAHRSHDQTQEVTLETLDVYQHQAPTTPGTSGSAMVHCGLVFAINNAGTVQMVVTPTQNGDFAIDRQAAAANNFGVHVRHIHEIVELFEANAVQGFELPVPAIIQQPQGGGGGGNVGGNGGGGGTAQVQTLTFTGIAETNPQHSFTFEVDVATGEIYGISEWGTNQYLLSGIVNLDTGEYYFMDNGPEVNPDFLTGVYFGYIYEDGSLDGYYAEDEVTNFPIYGEVIR